MASARDRSAATQLGDHASAPERWPILVGTQGTGYKSPVRSLRSLAVGVAFGLAACGGSAEGDTGSGGSSGGASGAAGGTGASGGSTASGGAGGSTATGGSSGSAGSGASSGSTGGTSNTGGSTSTGGASTGGFAGTSTAGAGGVRDCHDTCSAIEDLRCPGDGIGGDDCRNQCGEFGNRASACDAAFAGAYRCFLERFPAKCDADGRAVIQCGPCDAELAQLAKACGESEIRCTF